MNWTVLNLLKDSIDVIRLVTFTVSDGTTTRTYRVDLQDIETTDSAFISYASVTDDIIIEWCKPLVGGQTNVENFIAKITRDNTYTFIERNPSPSIEE